MANILIIISMIIAGFGLGKYISFSKEEGTDERGKFILAKASHITMNSLFFIFAILVLVVGFLNVSAEILGVLIVVVLSLLILINAISIMYFRKNM